MISNDFTKGKIVGPLMAFAIPVLFALLLQAMYGAVDLFIVGRFGSAADVSAVSTGGQIMQTITSIITGLAVGTTVLIGQQIGEGDGGGAGEAIGASIYLFGVLGIVVTALMVALASPISILMRAPEEALEPTVQYVRICSAGSILIIAYNVIESVFRGIGNSRIPLMTVAIACVFNIAGDILLVAVFKLGAAGAAIATVAAQGLSVFLSYIIIKKQQLPLSFSRSDIRPNKPCIARVLKLGAPIALQDALVSVSFLVILAIVNSMGLIASAGVGVAEKLCSFIMLLPMAFSQSLSAFVAQNIGAGEEKRAKKALWSAVVISLSISVFIAYAAFFHGDVLCSLFSKDSEVYLAGADYLRAYAIDTLLVSVMFCLNGYFNGCGKTLFVMAEGVAGAFLVRIPVSYMMSRSANATLFKVGLATPCSTMVQIILFMVYYIVLNRRSLRADHAAPADAD